MALGLIGTALAGAAVGAGKAGEMYGDYLSKSTLADEAAKIQRMRDEVLQGYAEKNIRTTEKTKLEFAPQIAAATATATRQAEEPFADSASRRKIEEDRARPIPAGATLRGLNGEPDWTAPTKLTPEQQEYWEERARYYRMLTNSGPKGDKEPLPKIVPMKDENGIIIGMIDEHSGAIGTPIPGSAGKPAVSRWFGPDEPAQPAKGADVAWTHNGRPLQNGLSDLYPQISARTGATSGGNMAPSNPPPLSSFDKSTPPGTKQDSKGIIRGVMATDDQAEQMAVDLAAQGKRVSIQGPAPKPPASDARPTGPTGAEISANPSLAQTSKADRRAAAAKRDTEKQTRRAELDSRIASANTPKKKMQLFREYQDVMTPQERQRFASGRD